MPWRFAEIDYFTDEFIQMLPFYFPDTYAFLNPEEPLYPKVQPYLKDPRNIWQIVYVCDEYSRHFHWNYGAIQYF